MLAIVGGLLVLCLLYCLIAPNRYDATAKVELRTSPASALNLEPAEPVISATSFTASVQLETLADVFRSGRLAWQVITALKLYRAPGFCGNFARRFPGFQPSAPQVRAQAWLLDRFSRRLHVQTVPSTFILEIRFRSGDAALSAAVVNALIQAYIEQGNESQMQATAQASRWLQGQLADLKTRVDRDDRRLAKYESAHGIVSSPETLADGQPGESEYNSTVVEMDELSRQLVSATSDRILREAEFRAASQGDPELVVATDPGLQSQGSGFATAVLQQIRAQSSALEEEQAQLTVEDGPNFPRVVEIRRELQDLAGQKKSEDAKLVERFHSAWQTAVDREKLVRTSLDALAAEGARLNAGAIQDAAMREEAASSHELYLRVLEKVEEAGMAAGIHNSNISVIDPARQPAKPAAPDLPIYLAITFFAGLWLAMGAALLAESLWPTAKRAAILVLAVLAAGAWVHAQAPTPSTSGLPTGVASFPQTQERKSVPNPKEAPAVWNQAPQGVQPGLTPAAPLAQAPMPAPIGPGDALDVSEYHTPEFHSDVRVSLSGLVTLPMIGDVKVAGLDEQAAAQAIEAALAAKGMLLHPLVSVLVTYYSGQDVSVLGEVNRPGVYPYTIHHRLLDLISAASGLTPNAGRLVNIFHRDDPRTPHPVVLDPGATDPGGDHNPELIPGDTVQVSRAGLVYVIGDVVRPGGFPVDPAQGLTVVQALSLAWGPSQNAATSKALLIREEKGGRVMIALNLKRMLRGEEPDQPVHDRDILFVPDSTAKNLWNRTMESAIQSAIGVTIYSALVYSQRY
ncbi:MAG: SLBB domain-containing protein [Terracidiphilus sp.]